LSTSSQAIGARQCRDTACLIRGLATTIDRSPSIRGSQSPWTTTPRSCSSP
jgi:hypothetical protein